MKCPHCEGEGLERLFFEEGERHHDPTVSCEECGGTGEIEDELDDIYDGWDERAWDCPRMK